MIVAPMISCTATLEVRIGRKTWRLGPSFGALVRRAVRPTPVDTPRGTVDDNVARVGRNLSDCPSLQGTQCRGVPSSMNRKATAVVHVLRRGHTLESLVAFVPVG